MNYNVETTNVEFINRSFLNKIEEGQTKEASVAMTAFVRQKLREDGFTRKILPPSMITSADLDRQLTEEPTILVEKEPDSVAASMSFVGRPNIRYFKGARYKVPFYKIQSEEFKKSKFELATYRTDIRQVLQENSIKDLQEQEDKNFYNSVVSIATANSNVQSVAGGFNYQNFLNGGKFLLQKKLPIGCALMTQSAYTDLLKSPATQIGSGLATDIVRGGPLDSMGGIQIITTNKSDILPDNRVIFFAPPNYLGQFYMLQDATVFLKTEADMLSFTVYESIGAGIGNINGAIVVDY